MSKEWWNILEFFGYCEQDFGGFSKCLDLWFNCSKGLKFVRDFG